MESRHGNESSGAFSRTSHTACAHLQVEHVESALFLGFLDALFRADQPALFAVGAVATAHTAAGLLNDLLCG